MKKYLAILCLSGLTVLGCGSVDTEMMQAAGGAGGAAGQPGTGGAGGAATSPDAGADAGCVPTACTTCVNGTVTPAADGTACGTAGADSGMPPTCSGLIGTDYRCKAGACVQGQNVDCTNFACPRSCDVTTCLTYNTDNVQQPIAACFCQASNLCS